MGITDTVQEYLRQGEAEGWSPQTVSAYKERLGFFAEFLAKTPIPDITPEDLQRLVVRMKRIGWGVATRKAYAMTLRQFFGWLAKRGKVLKNPAYDLRVEHDQERELPPEPLSVDEVNQFLDDLPQGHVVDLRNKAMMELIYGCGLRLNEALSLDMAHLNMRDKVVQIRNAKWGSDRDLPIGRGALHALRDYFAIRRSLLRGPDTGVVFLTGKGQRLANKHVYAWFRRMNESRGRKKRLYPHLFRHSVAVHLLQNGADIRHVQQFLGHKELDTTKIYLRMVPGRLKEDYEKAMPEFLIKVWQT